MRILLTLLALTTPSPAPAADDPGEVWPQEVSVMFNALPCVPGGPTSADAAVAAELNPQLANKMRGHMTAYNTSCARVIVETVQNRGLNERAAAIAIATVIVETSIANLDGGDLDSVGLYQQRASWGSFQQRTDPVWATNKFLDVMESFYPNGSWNNAPIGEVAADVQRPAAQYRYRYGVEANDAVVISGRLWRRGEPDVTGDGRADIVGTTDGRLRVYRGDGTGNFHPLSDGGTGWDSLADLDLGDFNGDGRADIVGRTGGMLRVYRGDGTGNFHAHAEGGTGWDSVNKLNLADVNGDGRADIVGETGGRLRVYRGDGTGNFHPWIDGGTGWDSLTQLEAGDFNGDGRADIIGVTGTRLRVYRGDGTGNFHPHAEGGTGWDSLAKMTVADFNGDRRADIIGVTDSRLRVYRGDGTGNFHPHAEGGTGWDSLLRFAA